jgi:hypothetical protein
MFFGNYRVYALLKDDQWAQSSKAAMEYNAIFYYSSSEYYGSSSSTIVHGNHFPNNFSPINPS